MQFDRRVGAALIFAIIVEGAAGLLWIGRAMDRLEQLEVRVAEHRTTGERLAVLESEMSMLRETLQRVESKLDGAQRR